ncbi:MAG: malate dehydrogenase [Acidobacteria bacterium]|nr:malate dehydrogenase [Acidobacteriota bacterium]
MNRKVSIIGAGNVGASTAERIVFRRLADVVLVDIIEGMPQGKALDLNEAGPIDGYDSRLTGSNGYEETAGSDVVVITSGLPRKPGMSRDDLLRKNFEIVRSVTQEVARRSPNAVLIIVSNPLDAMAYTALKASSFPRERVIGMAGVLDSARMRFFISEELGVSVENTHAFVLGGHGDSMVPLPRYSTVAGIPITELMSKERIEAIVQRTRDGGIEVVNLLKSGSAYYAPASSIVQMVEAILNDTHCILPCAVFLQGEYGYEGIYLGVPARLGMKGMEKVIEIKLTDKEKSALDRSADTVRTLIGKLDI